ncbi:hypothetical protein H632_c187p3 [Helicosporidium sp. ATCC 50920]|nr:hypothetical protein H632_c187p3 [Helicosporidium sp. ATCC 50920]|eukprot:KDD76547.1 hypothetical protein H632_c187p3 [Helicosporidium sp. ATCC 50920]
MPVGEKPSVGLEESCTFLALLECLILLHNGPNVVDPLYSRVPRALLAFLASRVFNSKTRFTYGLGPQGYTVLRCWILVAALRSTHEARLSQEDVAELAGELRQTPADLTKLAVEVGAKVMKKETLSDPANAVALLPDRHPSITLSKAFGTVRVRAFK